MFRDIPGPWSQCSPRWKRHGDMSSMPSENGYDQCATYTVDMLTILVFKIPEVKFLIVGTAAGKSDKKSLAMRWRFFSSLLT